MVRNVSKKEPSNRAFTPIAAREFYDRFGSKQDLQFLYEHAAIKDLIAHADFEHASAVFEFGFGTGKLAARLLSDYLPETSIYCGIDISATMADIAEKRLSKWNDRVQLRVFDGTGKLEVQNQLFDRFISTYVFDLLSPDDIRHVLSESHRILKPGGLLCNVSLTQGRNFSGKVITTIWKTIYSLNPKLVGGCRPIMLTDHISSEYWQIRYHNVLSTLGLASEVLIAQVVDS